MFSGPLDNRTADAAPDEAETMGTAAIVLLAAEPGTG